MWFKVVVKRCVLTVLLSAFVPASVSLAYTLVLEDGRILETQDFDSQEASQKFSYGLTTRQYGDSLIKHASIKNPDEEKPKFNFSFIGIAEASSQPTDLVVRNYLNMRRAVKSSARLKQIQPFVDEELYSSLDGKVSDGLNEHVVVEMMKTMMPDKVDVYEVDVTDDRAVLAVFSADRLGDLHGFAILVKQDDQWRLAEETWYGQENLKLGRISPLIRVGSTDKLQDFEATRYILGKPRDYVINNSLLDLERINIKLPKESFAFMFYLKKRNPADRYMITPDQAEKPHRPHLHILWTGPRKVLRGQKLYEDQYPINVSIAHYKQGYMPGNMNLRLPRKKPKQVLAGLLYKF